MKTPANTGRRLPPPLSNGFTLVELLTVMTIIAILAGILIPVVGKVRRISQRSSCASNMRQIGIGLLLYKNEHKTFPKQTKGGWTGGLLLLYSDGYVPSPAVFHCPADQLDSVPTRLETNRESTVAAPQPTSAQMSYLYLYWNYQSGGQSTIDVPYVENASKTSIVEDLYGGSKNYETAGNHSPDGGNILFLDGHVEWKSPPWNPQGWGNIYTF